ncbi:peptide ABC transporter substrate-binding protein [Leptolyngbya sp. BL0902]|uniref:peptide ABC transporter substrate-binding protein n=1 Tax=Leptolyngbya sp. BL0902 TaxID=1115757 RepID=UPI0019381F13|nr:peptide ABC transporter substrate-binding protein [Leptolyngbya sp. BL0902]QQE65464.1 peptide ABC transporter substrate-binding protein [Leptolyngbya sp. BL0902]
MGQAVMVKAGWRVVMTLATGMALLGAVACSPLGLGESATPPAEADVAPVSRDPNTLRLLYGRSVVTLNPHLATGYQDFEAARLSYEPLASHNQAGELIPFLAAEIPTEDNGGLSEDGTSVIWTLRRDVTWADGEPFTAEDVVFTFDFIRNPEVSAATAQFYDKVESVEALDDHRVKITFSSPTPAWDVPFTGQTGMILPQHHYADYNGLNAREAPANRQPVGTGPYQAIGFEPGTVIYEANPNHWDGRPAFRRVELQGGMAPYAAAREVLQRGSADFANNLQVEADALAALKPNALGEVSYLFGSQVERIMVNFANPFVRTEAGEQASPQVPHPYFSDWRVRQAINLAIDRDTIAKELYGPAGKPTAQLLVAPEEYRIPDLAYEYNLVKAKLLLEQAGWVDSDGDGVRDRNGVPLEVLFQASVNPVRQRTQTIVADSLKELGVGVQISRVRVDEFFSANPEHTNSLNHFYADMQIYSIGNESPDPTTYLSWWSCDKIASMANQWQEPNNARYCNPEYDRLLAEARAELDPDQRAALFRQMNEVLTTDVAVIPVVHRALVNAVSNRLAPVEFTPWDASTWNIKDWALAPAEPSATSSAN